MPRRGSSPLAFGVFGVLAMTFTAVVVIAALNGSDEAEVPAGPGTGPIATKNAELPPAKGVETTPPSFGPPPKLNLGSLGDAEIALAARKTLGVDLRYMRRSDTTARLKRNPLYGTGTMRPTACRAPRPSTRPGDMLNYLNAVTGCLDRAWSGKFSQAGAVFLAPRRVYWSRPGRGPCGTYPNPGAAAYYCPSNRGMYIGLSHLVQQTGRIDPAANHVPYLSVLAHEYGHHVQSMAGIGGAWWWEVSNKSKAAQDAHSRRSELQAQCLAGVFVRTVRTPLGVTSARWNDVLRMEYSRGDDQNGLGLRDHGSGDHYAGWLHQGWRYARVGYCNTWAVPASQVS
ncbi:MULTISPECIES: neutral zinc metallopeptidase [Streptosporangium]|uniref:Metalloprotease n=1 Tax=Streptosporangium brasiliense TaxID=47480 RepID=A0ABT9R1W6_9ACTN|nr:neutral zinc metallopeptidase [Streptosporangium brasiliense]MDP9863218.1 putative metalloprotease [Streptosporangium brasiliense]